MTSAPPVKRLVPPPPPAKPAMRAPKIFSIRRWTGQGEGKKIVLYGGSGKGKTTLASMLPNPVFIGADDGARLIRNPKTGEAVMAVEGVEDFQDVRHAAQALDLWTPGSTLVVDTITAVESWAEAWVLANVRPESGGSAKNLEAYGYGKGYKHMLDAMRSLLQDLDALVRRGVNICLLAQEAAVRIANSEGLDYIQDGPKLYHDNRNSVRLEVCEWADHVLRLSYLDLIVTASGPKDRKGKVQPTNTRAIFAVGASHFFAKSRTLSEPIVSFEEPSDDSIWQLLFGEKP